MPPALCAAACGLMLHSRCICMCTHLDMPPMHGAVPGVRAGMQLVCATLLDCMAQRLSYHVSVQQLPVRGQTTKNNARTRKGRAIAIAGKKK